MASATKKLNPSAPPFPRPCSFHHLVPPQAAPPMMVPYHVGAAFPPVGAAGIYVCAQFPVVPHHYHPFIHLPAVMHQSSGVFCKTTTGTSPPASRFLRKGGVSAKKPPPARPVLRKSAQSTARVSRKSLPSTTQPTKVVLCEDVLPAQPEHVVVLPDHVVADPVPHGLPPHKLMTTAGLKKPQDVAVECRNEEPAPECTAAAPDDQKPAARRRKAGRCGGSRKKSSRGRKVAVVGPRGVSPCRPRARSSSTFTTPRQMPLPEQPPARLGSCTTVMLRNIPNRLKVDQIIALLDEHCARSNRGAAGDVVSAYDVVYLPTDFNTQGNFGYAFVNFTTAAAARGLYQSLQGRGWRVCSSRKTIEIVPARIQGKEALVRHLSRQSFARENEEYRPAVFSPPRDGGTSGRATTTTRVGKLSDDMVAA